MGRRPKPLNPNHPLHAFAIELKVLRDAAGLAGEVKATCDRIGVNRTTYYAWLGGKQLPGRDVLELMVRAWGGDPAYWLARRREVETALSEIVVRRRQRAQIQQAQDAPTRGNSEYAQVRPARRTSKIPVSLRFDAARSQRIDEAQQALSQMGFDGEFSNERSAYVLLSLLNLSPEQEWAQAHRPMLRITEMMEWIREEYKRIYAPNTRETFRRLTLHAFVDAGLVIQNPDHPDRPINSPRWCYQIAQHPHALLRSYGTPDFERQAAEHRLSSAQSIQFLSSHQK